MFALDERTSAYLVVGVSLGARNRGLLPLAFQYAATECGADLKFDGFDRSVVELPKQSLHPFKVALYNTMMTKER